jgi:hypothetical protein
MNVRKLLDWRKLLIYSHRWLGIGITVMFLLWTLSGVVLMYYGHPQITTGERLLRLEPIDFSTATVTPAEAAAKAGIKPYRIRLSMYNGRPVYRLTRVSIGNWRTIYADTGEVLPDLGPEQALEWMKKFAHEYVFHHDLRRPSRKPRRAYENSHTGRVCSDASHRDERFGRYRVLYLGKEQRHRSENEPKKAAFSHIPATLFITCFSSGSAPGGLRSWITSPGQPCSWL